MKPIAIFALILTLATAFVPTATAAQHVSGIAYTEESVESILVEIWRLDHEDWRHASLGKQTLAAGESFAIKVEDDVFPLSVEISAANHVALAFLVAATEQLELPPAWLRRGEIASISIQSSQKLSEAPLVWGNISIGPWSDDLNRWQPVVPRTYSSSFEVVVPSDGVELTLNAIAENGTWAYNNDVSVHPGRSSTLKLNSNTQAIRVIDRHGKPVAGVSVAAFQAPHGCAGITDETGRTDITIEAEGKWKIFALADQGSARAIGINRSDLITLELRAAPDVELRWSGALDPIIARPNWIPAALGGLPQKLTGGRSFLPFFGAPGGCDFWGPKILSSSTRIKDADAPFNLPVSESTRLEGEVFRTGNTAPGLPVWVHVPQQWRVERKGIALPSQMPLESPWLPWSVSGNDGRFSINQLPALDFIAEARNDEGDQASQIVKAGQLEEVELRLEKALTISGTVFDPEDNPVAGAVVSAFCESRRGISDPSETDNSGFFEINGVQPGNWRIWVNAEDWANATEEVTVAEGKSAKIDLHLKAGGIVVGDVIGLSAAELASCRVRCIGSHTTPNSDGSFRLENVPFGEQSVMAMVSMWSKNRSVKVVVPESGESEPVKIDFESGLELAGTVRRAGVAVPGLVVNVQGVIGTGNSSTLTGADGEWQVQGLDSGEYEIAVRNNSGEVLGGDHILLEGDTDIDIDLEAGSIYGRIQELDTGRPIEHATATVSRSGVPPVERTVSSDSAGSFRVDDLADGDYTVNIHAPEYLRGRKSAVVAEGNSAEMLFELEAEDRLILVVREPDGRPASRLVLTTMAAGVLGPEIGVSCDSQGSCEVRDLPRGQWLLMITGGGMLLTSITFPGPEQTVILKPHGRIWITAPPAPNSAAWRVRITDEMQGLVVPVSSWRNAARNEWIPVTAMGLSIAVPVGAYVVEGFSPAGEKVARSATVTENAPAEIEFTNEP